MGDIIPFDKRKTVDKRNISSTADSYKRADAEFEETAKRFVESDGDEGLAEFLNAMGILADTVLNGPNVQAMQEREKKEEEEFLKRNQEIIRNDSKFDMGLRMQYYAEVLLGLADKIFHAEDGFSQPFDDFSHFMEYFDSAFSKYSKQYPDLEEEYHFTGELILDMAELERMVMECLKEIVQLKPNDSDKDKTRLLYCGSRLFEVYRNLLYFHSDDL